MCDTWVALRDATASGSVIFGKNSDRPFFDCQPLVLHSSREWPRGSAIQLEYISIPQVNMTLATLGSSPYWCWGYEEGINEYGVVIGNEAIFTKGFRDSAKKYQIDKGPDLGLTGMDIVRLALERAKSAEDAIYVIGKLVEEHGQFGSGVPSQDHVQGGYDNSYIVADRKEAWIVETVGKRWVARRVIGGIASISNEPSIRNHWDAGSSDIVDYAIMMKWWPEKLRGSFDFARAYIDDMNSRQVSHIRAQRSRDILKQSYGGIDLSVMKTIARDHYEGTFLEGPYFDAADPDFQSICMHVSPSGFTWGNTSSSCIAVLPKNDDDIPVFWWAPGPPCNSCYVPFFVDGSALSEIVSEAGSFGKVLTPPVSATEDSFSPKSYWWLFRRLMDLTKGDPIASLPGYYDERNPVVRSYFDELESSFEQEVPEIIERAQRIGGNDKNKRAEVFDQFTAQCVKRVVSVLEKLLHDFSS
ncbi:C69 family dipeptidase [Acetomicrobium sp. UBA5826]|uniref:C69 family dipeptidase n=1 Tax=Acetomicrobium sp. UBA5826 TaxID=1946039 RepID=UPI002580FB4B|nr:C69 family dipeptidase [Acetomicrobium sp. UBA5826]